MTRETLQSKLPRRIIPPRVHITYDVEIGGAIELKELPFVVGVLSPLSGSPEQALPRLKDRKFVEVDRDNFNQVLAGMKPRLAYRVDNKLSDSDTQMAVELKFNALEDFEPDQLVQQVEPLRKLVEARRRLSDLRSKMDGNYRLEELLQDVIQNSDAQEQLSAALGLDAGAESVKETNEQILKITGGSVALELPPDNDDLLERILDKGQLARDESQVGRAKDMIGEFVQQVMQGSMVVSKDIETSINSRIAAIDKLISAQLNLIMHAREFQTLEASWRGLHYLVSNTMASTMLKIRVLDVSKKELLKDFERAVEFDQSGLFKKIYEEEYGTFGGQPFGALIGDYEFGNHPQDLALLEHLSRLAAIAQAPFIGGASPHILGWNSFVEITEVRDLAKVFDRTEYMKWRAFRDTEESRYVGLTLPRMLMRLPYGPWGRPVEEFNFMENVEEDPRFFLWGNIAYAFGVCLTTAFAQYYWCATIRGVEGGGLVEGLPTHTFITDEGDVALKCPTEIAITDRREKEFSDLGFIPLVHCKNTDYAAFFSVTSCNKPRKYDSDAANANARLSTQLQYIFAVSRFAHYLKVMTRDKVGSFVSRGDCERFLNRWISNYVSVDDNPSLMVKAQFPLREARIDVAEVLEKPGTYKAVVFLRPHFQLDELSVSLRFVVELPLQTH
jgi:type VI secretion system protein ImpC